MKPPSHSSPTGTPDWPKFARCALHEDCANEDVTTRLLGERAQCQAEGAFIAEGDFVVAGLPLAFAVFCELDPSSSIETLHDDGEEVKKGACIARVRARGAVLLSGERSALNYLQRMCGIATATRTAVAAVQGTDTVIMDTRKTTPGLRALERYAVRMGGGVNHRAGLSDAILWKDNHWELLVRRDGGLAEMLRSAPPGLQVCVEVESEQQLDEALNAGVKWILVDNQTPDTVARWVQRAGPGVTVEASGGIDARAARAYAEAGASRISMGSLTVGPDRASISFAISFLN